MTSNLDATINEIKLQLPISLEHVDVASGNAITHALGSNGALAFWKECEHTKRGTSKYMKVSELTRIASDPNVSWYCQKATL